MDVRLATGLIPYNSVKLSECIEMINLLQPKFKANGHLTFS